LDKGGGTPGVGITYDGTKTKFPKKTKTEDGVAQRKPGGGAMNPQQGDRGDFTAIEKG